jgi:NAD-reducing hydrogenase large subunit
MAKAVMRHLALAQEAAIILGGRHEHPLTSLPGGVSCYLKNNSHERLEEIAGILFRFVGDLADFFRKSFWTSSDIMKIFSKINMKPMAGVSLDIRNSDDSENRWEDEIIVTDVSGKETSRFSIEKALDNIDLASESWSYLPFAFFRDKGWQGVKSGADSLFFTGPLARMNGNMAMDTEKAEEERKNMVEILGPFPHFSVCAAFWTLIVEAFQSAEKMTRLCVREKLTGPFTRQIPKTIGSESYAALESPQGIIYHHYRVDSKGLVENIRILDTSMENNALRCLVAQKAYEGSGADKDSWEETKNRIEVSLLPF